MTAVKQSVKHTTKQKSGFAIASFVLGIVSFIPLVGVIIGFTALILGIIALRKIKKEHIGGKRMAVTGIILGSLGVLFTFIIYGSLFYFGFVAKSGPFAEVRIQASQQILTQNAGYLELYKKRHGRYPDKLEELSKDDYAVFPVDHYMRPLYYKISLNKQSYDLRSLGPDGEFNTKDDIFLK